MINRFKQLLMSFWDPLISFTPKGIVNIIKSRLVIIVITLAICGFIGNRFDSAAIKLISWLFTKGAYYNIIILVFVIVLILLIWIVIAFIRVNDYHAYVDDKNSNVIMRKSSDEFYSDLTKIITESKYKEDLYISIGEGESLHDWLIRIFEESNSGRIQKPQIRSIHIKMLSPEMCKLLENNGLLSAGFSSRMNNNVNMFVHNEAMENSGVNIKLSYWSYLPPFHGFVFDKYFLINTWEVNSNCKLHVRTSLRKYNANDYPEKFNEIKKYFDL